MIHHIHHGSCALGVEGGGGRKNRICFSLSASEPNKSDGDNCFSIFCVISHHSHHTISLQGETTMKLAFVAAFFGAICAQNAAAFSPASRSKVLNNLKEMSMEVKMTGAGGAAQPDQYVEGKCYTWNRGDMLVYHHVHLILLGMISGLWQLL